MTRNTKKILALRVVSATAWRIWNAKPMMYY